MLENVTPGLERNQTTSAHLPQNNTHPASAGPASSGISDRHAGHSHVREQKLPERQSTHATR